MMVGIAPSPWRVEFARKAAMARDLEKRLRDEKLAKDKRERDEQEASAAEHADMLAMVELVLASDQHIEAFTVKLDALDAATVEALMQNEEALVAVRERIAAMLLDAHVLPDGRPVFKTRDGTEVYDEFGAVVSAEEITPEEIDDTKPRWEDLQEEIADETRLVAEREDLLAYQEKLDDARERLDDPTLTEDELSALEHELGEATPERVTAILTANVEVPEQAVGGDAAPVAEQDKRAPLDLPLPAGP